LTTAFLTHPLFHRFGVPTGHPECPQRVSAIVDELHSQGIYDLLQIVEPVIGTRDALCRVHAPEYVDYLESLAPADSFIRVDPDTFLGSDTLTAAKLAAGAAVTAVDLVLEGRVANAFCNVRPPGHHAGRASAMGFCYFNNVAVGVAHAIAAYGMERVAVLDFDVHHGNGTEQILAGNDRVLLCSSFQHPFYPYSGIPASAPNVVSVPLAAGSDGRRFREALLAQWGPAIEDFAPQLVFISAGFDGHVEDELAGLALVDEDYRWVSDWIAELAARHAGGRIVSCLEGGYALQALARCVTAHVRVLAGLP